MVDVVEIVFSTNCNCPRGRDDATIALSVRTLYIASESDTSLQSVHTAGKSGPFDWAGLGLTSAIFECTIVSEAIDVRTHNIEKPFS